ncbi:MAG: hypothetical protein OXE79_00955 [Acidimicrobiaceae bacterium]|nr:hypothetical protein [Acidimicrobiaceae bacterium]
MDQPSPQCSADSRATRPTLRRKGDRGDSVAFVLIWPVLIMAVLVLTVHAFIVGNARSQAEVAASEGLRAVWRTTATAEGHPSKWREADSDDSDARGFMVRSAEDAVAFAAADESGWRWWTPGAATVSSDWCPDPEGILSASDPDEVPGTEDGDAGWVRVEVQGEVLGPLAAFWPDTFDSVQAVALGPAVLKATQDDAEEVDSEDNDADRYYQDLVPAELPVC